MTLEQAQAIASDLATRFNRKSMIDPTFKIKKQAVIALCTNASDYEVGYSVGYYVAGNACEIPKHSRTHFLGKAWF